MGKTPAEFYWDKNNHKYPHQCKVAHMSPQDLDPRVVQKEVNFYFLRVPFNGESHWGFQTEEHMIRFLTLVKQK